LGADLVDDWGKEGLAGGAAQWEGAMDMQGSVVSDAEREVGKCMTDKWAIMTRGPRCWWLGPVD
jgi:hypothetical protein